jgi:Outer membrane protein beta-barrel domain
LAYGGAKSDTTIAQSVTIIDTNPLPSTLTSGLFSQTRVGYAVGAGGEWMLSSNWSAKLEYLYYDLGSATYTTGGIANDPIGLPRDGTAAVATSSKVRFNDNIVRVGVNYHFRAGLSHMTELSRALMRSWLRASSQRVVPANQRVRLLPARWQALGPIRRAVSLRNGAERPSITTDAGGYGSLRSQGRLVETQARENSICDSPGGKRGV